jgi:uncharacterized RDD family membrane protein YckC
VPELNDPSKPKITFKPLTPGLGFNQFSDHLPYGPAGSSQQVGAIVPPQKTQTTTSIARAAAQAAGSGAVSAGPATFVMPSPSSPSRPLVKQAPRVAPKEEVETPVRYALQGLSTEESQYGMTYLIKRTLAYLIDSFLNLTLCAAALSAALWRQDVNPDMLLNDGVVVISVLFILAFNWALIVAQEIAFGTSLGKKVFGLALEGTTWSLLIRSLLFILSVAFCGVGLFWSLIDSKRRCWHDLVSGNQPIELAEL